MPCSWRKPSFGTFAIVEPGFRVLDAFAFDCFLTSRKYAIQVGNLKRVIVCHCSSLTAFPFTPSGCLTMFFLIAHIVRNITVVRFYQIRTKIAALTVDQGQPDIRSAGINAKGNGIESRIYNLICQPDGKRLHADYACFASFQHTFDPSVMMSRHQRTAVSILDNNIYCRHNAVSFHKKWL